MGLNFCEHEDVVFDRAPLVLVLSQVRFPAVLSLMNQAGIAGFQEVIRDTYPILLDPERSATIELSGNQVGVRTAAPVWRLTDADGIWAVNLASDFVALETSRYTDLDDFLGRFDKVLDALRRTIRPADSTRIGLRKINRLRQPGNDTSDYVGKLRAELLGPLGAATFPASIAAYFSQMDFRDDDNMLAVRYGLEPSDEGMSFILDMDYYTERPQEVQPGNSLTDLLRYFGEGTTSFFHWALTDTFKSNLGPKVRERGKS